MSRKPVSLHWDYYDQIAGLGAPYGYEQMRKLCRDAKAAGVDSINFRVEGAGMAWVPNRVRPMFERYDHTVTLDWSDYSRLPAAARDSQERNRVANLFKQTYQTCPDPLSAAVAAAKEAGLQLNVYLCPYDQYFPGVPGTYVEQHPEHCIASRDGESKLSVPSLAYPAYCQWLLAYYDAVLAYDVDDVVIYPGSHAWYSYPIDTPDDWFGFEEPSVKSYFDKTGIDVKKQEFDIDDYYRHYGQYWTDFLSEISKRQQARQKRLIVGMDMGQWQVYLPWGSPRLMTTWRHYNDWQTWVKWGNVDLCAGHQVNMWEFSGWPANRLEYMPGQPDRPPYKFAQACFGKAPERNFKLWAFLTLHADKAETELPRAWQGVYEEHFDGLMLREAADFEFKLGWDVLRATDPQAGAPCCRL